MPQIIKIATMVFSDTDTDRLRKLYDRPEPIIAIGMGEKGKITRIRACEWGAPFTYAAPYPDELTAPGQLCYQEMKCMM